MNRRDFTKLAGVGALGLAAPAGAALAQTTPERRSVTAPAIVRRTSTSDKKAWARDHIVGLEHVILPSFVPGTFVLDEEALRWDMRELVRGGFTMVFVAPSGLAPNEWRRFVDIVIEEARGKLLVSAFVGLAPTLDANIAEMKKLEAAGVSHALLNWPASILPATEDQLYAYVRSMAEATGMGLCLYATTRADFTHLHPSGVPFSLFDRLVQIPNIVSMKVGFFEQGLNFELFERYHDKVLTNIGAPALVGEFPVLHRLYKPQWGGAGIWHIWQSPEKPYLVDYFNHVMRGEYDRAMLVYWRMYPLQRYALKHVAYGYGERFNEDPSLYSYLGWSVGANGGRLRGGQVVSEEQMDERDQTLRQAGITPAGNREEFWVGRVNYAKGVRRSLAEAKSFGAVSAASAD